MSVATLVSSNGDGAVGHFSVTLTSVIAWKDEEPKDEVGRLYILLRLAL